MKKFLSLVLALVMTMSLVTVASAAEYKDDSSIEYEEAVAVISGAGIVGGYADGTFNPKGTLTRQAAAKIICNLTLGTTAADALGTTVAPFKDVPADSQFGGYIAYCAQMNYISGYADGTFRPTATLTGFAFLKMLECALGYDQTIEGLVGTNWAVNVARLALDKELIDGNDSFVGSKAITREEACLYALNALEAQTVSYTSKGTNITTTDGTVVNVGATPASDRGAAYTLAKVCQKKLDLGTWGNDEFNGPSRTITFDNVKIGTFSKKADKVYTEKVKGKTIWADLALNSNVDDYKYAVDGTAGWDATGTLTKADETEFGDDGVMTYVYKVDTNADSKADTVIICSQSLYTDKITAVGKNTAGDRVVKIDGLEYVTEDFAKGDIVSYTKDDSQAAADKIQSMVALEKATGKVTKKVGTDTYYIDGTKYSMADQGTNGGSTTGDEVEYYLDATGTIGYIKTTDATASVDSLAYVESTGTTRGNFAVLRFADGTKKTVDTDKDYGSGANDFENYIVKFSVSDSGEYKLSDKSGAAISAANTTYKNGATATVGTVVNVDSKTVFLYKVGTTYTQYVGKENAPSFQTASKIVAYTDTVNRKAATFVYVEVNGTVSTDSSKLSVIAFKSGTKVTTDKDGLQYYEYNAIVDGEVGTIKVATGDWGYLYTNYNYEDTYSGFLALTATSVDSDGVTSWNKASDELVATVNPTVKVEDNVVYIGATGYAYTSDVVVYFVDNKDHKVSIGTIDDIVEDNNGDQNEYDDVAVKTNTSGKATAFVIGVNP